MKFHENPSNGRPELFHADGRTARHDEANSCFSQFCEADYKLVNMIERHRSTQKPLAV